MIAQSRLTIHLNGDSMCVPWWQRNAETRERWSAQILHLEARIVARVGGDRHGPCTSHSLRKLNPFQTEAEASTHRGFLHRWRCRGRETRGMRRCGAGAHTVALSYPVVRSALHECKASQHQDQYVLSCACREVSSEASELVLFS